MFSSVNSKMSSSQITLHIHSCTRRQNQKEAESRIDELYPQTRRCPFKCNADLSSLSRVAYAGHLKQHISTRAHHSKHHAWRCGVIVGNTECAIQCVSVFILCHFDTELIPIG
jgi:hypothetical protein